MLHGFPDTAWSWRRVGPSLGAAGWRVVAPFSRGYAPTDLAPDGNYQVGALVRDVIDLHVALGGDHRAVLVGHDWGALTAYGVGALAPDRFARIVAMSVPPRPTLERAFRGRPAVWRGVRQARKSWYIGLNQLPGVSEQLFLPLVRRLWHDWSPGYNAAEDLAHVASALSTRRRRAAALAYYRALAQPWRRSRRYAAEQRAALAIPTVPTLYLHGDRDGALLPELAADVEADLPRGSRAIIVPAAGHFPQLERPALVAEEIVRFVS
jgi:pimeloyl-ACP methyl ester carboxylesterase